MKQNFERCLALVLVHEGGWADHPRDPGGATMRGVTLATFRQHYGADRTKDDLRRITDAQLSRIYRVGYWNKVGCDRLANGVDFAVFDFAVNSGPSRARSYLLKSIGGPDTETINRLCDRRMAFLRGLKTWPTFGKGWTTRVESVRREALRMASGPAGTKTAAKPQTAPVKPVGGKAGAFAAFLAIVAAVVAAVLKSKGVI